MLLNSKLTYLFLFLSIVGLSLVKIDAVDSNKGFLYLSGVDLVDGTPVYDVKPVVPFDVPNYKYQHPAEKVTAAPGYESEISQSPAENCKTVQLESCCSLTVPWWVAQNDELTEVVFEESAIVKLTKLNDDGCFMPLYGVMKKKHVWCKNSSLEELHCIQSAISEVLAQDPRSAKVRGTNSSASGKDLDPYRLVFCCAEICFIVGNDGLVKVIDIQEINFKNTDDGDGVPLADIE
mmetsp:Transcript_28233/g.64587  ORF Transcript_28233/g.64587 Transcript_28233/m.64587 type:complete len:235 (-) Transcript_28233:12-716(-)